MTAAGAAERIIGDVDNGAAVNNYGDIVLVPGILNIYARSII